MSPSDPKSAGVLTAEKERRGPPRLVGAVVLAEGQATAVASRRARSMTGRTEAGGGSATSAGGGPDAKGKLLAPPPTKLSTTANPCWEAVWRGS